MHVYVNSLGHLATLISLEEGQETEKETTTCYRMNLCPQEYVRLPLQFYVVDYTYCSY